jgi:transposase
MGWNRMAGSPLRFPAKRKLTFVQRLLRGESLEKVSRETNVPVDRLHRS